MQTKAIRSFLYRYPFTRSCLVKNCFLRDYKGKFPIFATQGNEYLLNILISIENYEKTHTQPYNTL